MKYLINNSNNPGYNLAFEEYCFKNLPLEEKYIFFWINRPAIIVGKNQNTIEEIDREFVYENRIEVIRRITGGGAVYHDLGNLNFTIITESNSKSRIDFKRYNKSIIKALKKLDIDANLVGRNDIVIDNKKISGIAQSVSRGRVLNHGTLMFDVNLDMLEKSLDVRQDKLKSKGVKSIRSRVTNIKEHLKEDMDIEQFKNFLLKSLFSIESEKIEEYKLNEKQLKEIDKLYNEKYSNWNWNFGKSPKSEYKNYKNFQSGSIEIGFDIIKGRMSNTKIYGDFFGREDINQLEKLLNEIKYSKEEIENKLLNTQLEDYFGKIDEKEFINLIIPDENRRKK